LIFTFDIFAGFDVQHTEETAANEGINPVSRTFFNTSIANSNTVQSRLGENSEDVELPLISAVLKRTRSLGDSANARGGLTAEIYAEMPDISRPIAMPLPSNVVTVTEKRLGEELRLSTKAVAIVVDKYDANELPGDNENEYADWVNLPSNSLRVTDEERILLQLNNPVRKV